LLLFIGDEMTDGIKEKYCYPDNRRNEGDEAEP